MDEFIRGFNRLRALSDAWIDERIRFHWLGIYPRMRKECARVYLEDWGLQREEAHAAVEGVGFLHRHVPGRRSSLRRHP